ncbi:hypothetical protein PO909_030290 [Leuciscus waleckii]
MCGELRFQPFIEARRSHRVFSKCLRVAREKVSTNCMTRRERPLKKEKRPVFLGEYFTRCDAGVR